MQIINLTKEIEACQHCGNNLSILGSFTYKGDTVNDSKQKFELCTCKKCGQDFTLHYDLFDDDGHVQSFVFNGDINDPTYNWQDQLTPEQKVEIESHLKSCQICRDRLAEEMLSDAWLASIMHGIKKSTK